MAPLTVLRDYLVWHYSVAYNDLVHVWWNYVWFVNHLFSVPQVIGNLFAPFKRLEEKKANILLHPEEFFSSLFVNIMMRIVGFVIRLTLVAMALCCFLIVIIGGLLMLGLWTALPVLVASFFINGFQLLLT